MNKIIKETILISIASLLLAAGYLTCNLLFNPSLTILDCVFIPIWLAGAVQAYVVAVRYLNGKTAEEGVRIGFTAGLIFKWSVFFLPLFISPYLAYKYYQHQNKKYKIARLRNN